MPDENIPSSGVVTFRVSTRQVTILASVVVISATIVGSFLGPYIAAQITPKINEASNALRQERDAKINVLADRMDSRFDRVEARIDMILTRIRTVSRDQ